MKLNKFKVFLFIAILILIALNVYIAQQRSHIESEIQRLEQEQKELEQGIKDYQELLNEVDELLKRNDELQEKYQEVIDILEIDTKEITMYAPLDPEATEGM